LAVRHQALTPSASVPGFPSGVIYDRAAIRPARSGTALRSRRIPMYSLAGHFASAAGQSCRPIFLNCDNGEFLIHQFQTGLD
jgi:hypothetical protein